VLNPVPQSAKSVASVGAISPPTGVEVAGGAWLQVSRLGMPLVNEVIIGLPDKDRWNSSSRRATLSLRYVTNRHCRSCCSPVRKRRRAGTERLSEKDLEEVFLTGVTASTSRPMSSRLRNCALTPRRVTRSPRRTISACWAETPAASRTADARSMTWSISASESRWARYCRLLMAAPRTRIRLGCITPTGYTDGVEPDPTQYLAVFPYLNTPLAGSPVSATE